MYTPTQINWEGLRFLIISAPEDATMKFLLKVGPAPILTLPAGY